MAPLWLWHAGRSGRLMCPRPYLLQEHSELTRLVLAVPRACLMVAQNISTRPGLLNCLFHGPQGRKLASLVLAC